VFEDHSPERVPGNRDDEPKPYWPGLPNVEDATRLWRDAGARREEVTPGIVLDLALEGIGINDGLEEGLAWIRGAFSALAEGGLEADSAHYVMWALAERTASCHEDYMGDFAPRLAILCLAGAPQLAALIERDVEAFERRMVEVRARTRAEASAMHEWRRRGWAPPGRERPESAHQMFRDQLATSAGGTVAHAQTVAGLLVLEFFEAYHSSDRESAAPDSAIMTKAREAILRLAPDTPLGAALARVANRVQLTPRGGNEGLDNDLLEVAIAYRAAGAPLLAADVSYTIVRGWEFAASSAEPVARRILREIERECAAGPS
jgi:hypothetical protein